MQNLISAGGILGLLAIGWLLSTNRKRVSLRVVVGGVGMQLLFGAVIFCVPSGRAAFLRVNDFVNAILVPATAGAQFVFGPLGVGPGGKTAAGEPSVGFILAFQTLSMIVFFSALMAMLYYVGVLPFLIRCFAQLFSRLMKISGAESLCAASNIFVGVESATTVRPFLEKMTRSELCVVLTAGMATVSSNIMGLYVLALGQKLPTIAGHLVSASILSAPAAVVMAKLLLPEEGEPQTLGQHVDVSYDKEPSLFEAVIAGSESGMKMALGVATLLLSMLGLVALVDLGLAQISPELSLTGILQYPFIPLAWMAGIPASEAGEVARILGERLIKTEVAGYFHLAAVADTLSPRTVVVTSYALCGFTHVASVAIFVGGIAALVPSRRTELAQTGWRALLAATLACMMTACVAGLFYAEDASGLLLPHP